MQYNIHCCLAKWVTSTEVLRRAFGCTHVQKVALPLFLSGITSILLYLCTLGSILHCSISTVVRKIPPSSRQKSDFSFPPLSLSLMEK